MFNILSRMSISRQFILLATLGVMLTVAGLALALTRSHDLAYTANAPKFSMKPKKAPLLHAISSG